MVKQIVYVSLSFIINQEGFNNVFFQVYQQPS